jgi:effector-binding domain-containing protein
VEARLRRIQEEGNVSEYEIVVKSIEPALIASVRDTIQGYPEIGRLYGELYPYLGRQGVFAPKCGAIWHDQEHRESDIDTEAFVFLKKPVREGDRVKVRELPAVRSAACLVHKGSYRRLDEAYGSMMEWIAGNGYRITGPNREIYLKGGQKPDDESYVTELQFPVEKA